MTVPMQRMGRATLFLKLAGLIGLIQIAAIGGLAAWLTRVEARDAQAAIERKTSTYAGLVAEQVRSAVAFDDKETARETFDAVSSDADVDALALYTEDGALLYARGDVPTSKDGPWAEAPSLRADAAAVEAWAPVRSVEGPKGTLLVRLSTASLQQAAQARLRAIGAATGAVLLVSLLGAALVARALSRRVGAIAGAAERVAAGHLDEAPLGDRSGDELGVLARGFDAMVERLRQLVSEIRASAEREQERLEALVQARTAALEARHADMRRVLDNVDQGLVIIDRQGRLGRERSAILERWLGAPSGDVGSYLARGDATQAAWIEASWAALVEDVLPRELALAQMPRRIQAGDRPLDLAFSLICDADDAVTGALVVVTDASAEVARERAQREERETVRLIRGVVDDRDGVVELMAEGAALMASALDPAVDGETLRRALHTLKGCTAQFGVESISELCHAIEGELAEAGGGLTAAQRAALEGRWAALSDKLGAVLGHGSADEVRAELVEYERLLALVSDPRAHELLASWRQERVGPRLERYGRMARGLAERLGQPPLSVTVDARGVRAPSRALSAFWPAFVHLVRNAVDHGAPQGRAGHLELSARRDHEGLVIAVRDHGGGVDWARVAERARAQGLPCASRQDLEAALFADGFSTRDDVSATSGRGVGLSAVRAACAASGASLAVHSGPDGTRFEIRWPAALLAEPRAASLRRSITPERSLS